MRIIVLETEKRLGKVALDKIAIEVKKFKENGASLLVLDENTSVHLADSEKVSVIQAQKKLTDERIDELRERYNEALTKGYVVLDDGITLQQL